MMAVMIALELNSVTRIHNEISFSDGEMPATHHNPEFCFSLYRIAGYFRGVLIFVVFVTNPGVTKFCTHEVFHLRYRLLVLLLT